MADFILSKFMFPMLLPGCAVLAVVGLGCLIYCKGKYHRYLARTAAVFLGALALLLGGGLLLDCFGLTWRNLPSLALCGILLVSGWVGIIFTLTCFLDVKLPELAPILRWAAKGAVAFFAAVVFIVTLWIGPLGIAFVYGNPERVVDYQGQTLLEVDDGFLDPHYSYYEYHGPLVRGKERVYDGYEPLIHS